MCGRSGELYAIAMHSNPSEHLCATCTEQPHSVLPGWQSRIVEEHWLVVEEQARACHVEGQTGSRGSSARGQQWLADQQGTVGLRDNKVLPCGVGSGNLSSKSDSEVRFTILFALCLSPRWIVVK